MSDIGKLGLKLLTLAAIGGLALGATNAITKGPIAEQAVATAAAARQTVLPEAVDFQLVAEADGDVTEIYQGLTASGETAGYTAKTTVQGFGGPIEVTIGVNSDGTVTGANVGGTDFSETAGLGAKTKDPAFYDQFAGKTGPFELRKNGGEIDAVTSATISSTAVKNGVNTVYAYLTNLIKEGN